MVEHPDGLPRGDDPQVPDPAEEMTMKVETSPLSTLGRIAGQSPRDFEAVEKIARGGMGTIYRVHDEALHRNLAMKLMHGERGVVDPDRVESGPDSPPPDTMLQRFLQEAQIMGQLDHPGVVPVYELGLNGEGRLFFTMKLVRGRTLAEIIKLVGAGEEGWTLTKAVQVFIRLCETLAFAHTKSVIHRDLKPDNVMVGRFGEVYLMDWGLAKVCRREQVPGPAGIQDSMKAVVLSEQAEEFVDPLTEQGDILGTPMYMPPEQVAPGLGEQAIPGDIYSVGAMLYHLLVGQPPYLAQDPGCRTIEILEAIRAGPPKPAGELAPKAPVELAAIAGKAMAREPGDRYASAGELAEDLHRYLEGHVVGAHGTGPLIELRMWIRRNTPLAASFVLILMFLVGGTLGIAFRERKVADDIAREADLDQEEAERNLDYARRWCRTYPTVGGCVNLALRLLREGEGVEAEVWTEKARALEPETPQGHYGDACVHAWSAAQLPPGSAGSARETALALESLDAAISAGWSGWDLMRNEELLVPLHGEPRWEAYFEGR
jgi:serine/threonine protein kinase